MNIGEAIDGMIGILAPEAGLRRARARMATGMIKRRYDGARADRLTKGWTTAGTSADAEIWPDRAKLANRARDLVRNNPHAKRAVDIMVSHIVGSGIRPIPRTGNRGRDELTARLWAEWSKNCDAGERYTLAAMQAMMVRSMVEGGEALIRFRMADRSDRPDLPPLRIQMLEGDYLDDRATYGTTELDRTVSQGIEMDDRGRRQAYYLYQQHPGDNAWHPTRLVGQRVPASDVLHLFLSQRIGQNRGVSWLHPVVSRLKHLDEFEEAEVIQKRIETSLAAFIVQPEPTGGPLTQATSTLDTAQQVVAIEPGMINRLLPGEDLKYIDPARTADSDFTMRMMRAIAAGVGPTYHQLSGDLRQANFSSLRAGSVEFWQLVEQIQLLTVVPLMLEEIWRKLIDSARMAGLLPRGNYQATWILPERQPIDPQKDTANDILEVRAGFASPREKMLKRGNDPAALVATCAEDYKIWDEAGLLFDTDPRNNTSQGNARTQSQAQTGADDAEKDDPADADSDEEDDDEAA